MQNLKSISVTLSKCQQKLSKQTVEYNLACAGVKQERRRLRGAKTKRAAADEAQQLAQHVAQAIQQQAHKRISEVVTRCLAAVFGDDAYEFDIQFDRKRGKTEARMRFLKDGKERHPLRASGGGMVDCASFALRLACIILTKPKTRRLLVLDEPLKWVNGEEYQQQVGRMFEVLAKEMQVQMIIVSDDDWLRIGKIIEIS